MRATDLLAEMSLADAGWIKHEGPQGTAFFPETARNEQEWEVRSEELHHRLASQVMRLDPKPPDRTTTVRA